MNQYERDHPEYYRRDILIAGSDIKGRPIQLKPPMPITLKQAQWIADTLSNVTSRAYFLNFSNKTE